MTHLFLDLETYSEVPIAHGVHRYADKAEILLAAWAEGAGPVAVEEHPSTAALGERIARASSVCIHNSYFDRTVLAARGIDLPVAPVRDTMVTALSHSLPGGLSKLCEILRVPFDKAKDAEGRKLIHLFCKPRPAASKTRRATRETHPEQWARFVAYARRDVARTTAALKRVIEDRPPLPDEQAEALAMVFVKIGRIAHGDRGHADNWRDIAGYALLVLESLETKP